MPAVLLDLNAFTQLAVRSGVAGYSGPGQPVTYSIDLEAYNHWLGTEMKEQGSFAPLMLHLLAGKQLPNPDDNLRVLDMEWYGLEPQTPQLVTLLAVSNASGYNHDARSHKWDNDVEQQQRMCTASPAERGSFQQHAYTPCCVKFRPSGITLQDYVDAVFQVKSGKRDVWYESLMRIAGCRVEAAGIAGTLKLCVELQFDHGS